MFLFFEIFKTDNISVCPYAIKFIVIFDQSSRCFRKNTFPYLDKREKSDFKLLFFG